MSRPFAFTAGAADRTACVSLSNQGFNFRNPIVTVHLSPPSSPANISNKIDALISTYIHALMSYSFVFSLVSSEPGWGNQKYLLSLLKPQ